MWSKRLASPGIPSSIMNEIPRSNMSKACPQNHRRRPNHQDYPCHGIDLDLACAQLQQLLTFDRHSSLRVSRLSYAPLFGFGWNIKTSRLRSNHRLIVLHLPGSDFKDLQHATWHMRRPELKPSQIWV